MDDMSVWLRVLLSVAVAAAAACSAPADTAAVSNAVASGTPARVASPDPARLPRPDEEQLVREALANADFHVDRVFPSKFEWLFGSAAPRSGTFQGAIDGTQTWADVHFLDGSMVGITACLQLDPTRETAFTVSVQGRPQMLSSGNATGYLGSAGPMYFAVGQRIFVVTPDVRLRDALMSSFKLSVPGCVWREPATLSVLPWESEVLDALQGGGVQIRLVGGTKFESFLGTAARHGTSAGRPEREAAARR